MHFSLSDALHHQQWLYLSVHIQMAPHRTELHTRRVDFLTSWYCQFIRGKLNNHPLQQHRSAKYNPVKWWTQEHRTSFQLFSLLKPSSLQPNLKEQVLTDINTSMRGCGGSTSPVRATPGARKSMESLPSSLGCGYLNGHVHPPHHSQELPSTPLPKHLPSPCNISLSNRIMENLVCLYD